MFISSRNFFALGLGALLLMASVQGVEAGEGKGHWKNRHGHEWGSHDWRAHPGRGYGPPAVVYTDPRVFYVPRPVYVAPPPIFYVPREPSISIVLPIDIR